MTATVTCIWVMVFTSSMLQTTVTSRYTNCRFNVTDLGCPVYGYTDWDCLKYEASCPKGTDYHCLRLHSEHSRYADGCDRSKECSKGEMPYWALIYDGIPTHVICDWCHDIEYFNPEKKSSSTYSHCPLKKVKCDYYNGIECLPWHKTDIYKQDRLCRCDARNNYVFGDLKRLKGQVCTSDQFLTTDCIRAEPCKDGQERLLNYTCVNKCKNGFRSNTSDECQPFLFTQPPFTPIVEPTEKPGEPLPTAQSRNTKETTTSSTISSRKISYSPAATITSKDLPTLKSEVIQTTTKPIKPESTSISANVLVICAILVLLIGIGIKLWQWRRSYHERNESGDKTVTDPFISQGAITSGGSAEHETATPNVEEPTPVDTEVEHEEESEENESSQETGAITSGGSAGHETATPNVVEPTPVDTEVEHEEESEENESSQETGAITSGGSAGQETATPNVEEPTPVETEVEHEEESEKNESSQETATEQDSDATLRLDQKRTQSDPTIGSTPITGPSQALSPSIPAADLEFVVELLPDLQPKSPLEIIATEQDSDSTLRLDQKRIQSDPTIGSTPITGPSQALSPSIPATYLEFVDKPLPDLQPMSPHEIIDKKHHSNFHNRMTDPKEILYRNWLKAGLGLLYVKEGIRDFIVEEIKNFHSNVLGTLPGAGRCTIHTIQNVIRCPTRGICRGRLCLFHDNTVPGKTYTLCLICETIRKEIELAHRYGTPSYKNTRSELWCTDSWELAKCFMPAQGYSDKNTADDTDLSGLISVILNSKAFQDKITENLGHPGNKFEKVRNARNDIMHNAKMETSTTDLNSYFNILNDVLNDSKYLQHLTKVKDAKDKLHQLQWNITAITTEVEQMGREECLKALERKKEECIHEIDKKAEEYFKENVQKIDTQQEENVHVIDTKKEDSLQEIDTATHKSKQEIYEMSDQTIQELSKMKEKIHKIEEKIKLHKFTESVQRLQKEREQKPDVPPYESKHTVIMAPWSYPEDMVSMMIGEEGDIQGHTETET